MSTLLVVIFSPCVETLSADALQALVRHKDYTTTQRYTNMARQLTRSVEGLRVPDVLKPAVVG